MTTIDEAFEEVTATLNYLDQFRTLAPMHEDRDAALYALDLIRERIGELEGALERIATELPFLAARSVARAALSAPSKEE